jgi:hypothetical protein
MTGKQEKRYQQHLTNLVIATGHDFQTWKYKIQRDRIETPTQPQS